MAKNEKILKLFDKALTAEEFVKKCEDAGIKIADLSEGEYVSTEKHKAELIEAKKESDGYKGQIKTIQEELDKLSKTKQTVEELQKAQTELITKHNNELLAKDKEIANKTKIFSIKNHLTNAGAKDVDLAFKALDLDLDKIEIKDEKIIGLEERVADLQKNKDFLFNVKTPAKTNVSGQPGGDTTILTDKMRAAAGLPAKKTGD